MDDQQVRSLNLGWLACAFESEGHFSFFRQQKKKYINYYPCISLVNTDDKYIEACDDILSEHQIPHYVEGKRDRGVGKTTRCVKICGFRRCKKFLDVLLPYLKTKRKRANVLLEIINYRLSLVSRIAPYTHREEDAYRTMKMLNGNLRDYTPNTKLVMI